MASSCIPAGLRLPDLDMVKAAAAASAGAPLRPANSSASSAISDASNSSSASSLSLKRPRTPRKRPNQTYNEAAALLASMYPSVFPAAAANAGDNAPRLLGLASALADHPSRADLLPPFPVLGNAACLLRDAAPPTPPPRSPVLTSRACPSPAAVSSAFTEFRDSAPGTPDGGAAADGPGELDFEDDDDGFDADSFLLGGVQDGAAEGIDGIMGKLSMESSSAAASSINRVLSSSGVDPYVRNLMVLGLGFQRSRSNMKQALKRHDDDSEWWMCPAIPLKEIMPAPPPSMAPPLPVEKKKKKTKKKALKDIAIGPCINICVKEEIPDPAYGDDGGILGLRAPKTGLGLSLNTEEVLKAWYDRGSVFADGNIPDSSSADGLAKLSDIELFLENGAAGAIRESGIKKMQHKQKQCTPLVSNKTRYQARKVHAESRPRVKGRFVSQASLLRKAGESES